MSFLSLEFAVFFSLFFMLYWTVFGKTHTAQNLFLLVGSYLFYIFWDWRFLSLLLGSSLLNYKLGDLIGKTENEKTRKIFLYLGLVADLGVLIFFKYYNFFVESFAGLLSGSAYHPGALTLNLILPLGISFFTFKMISYLLDVHNEKMEPARSLLSFLAYVAFFPTLFAGPIDKARTFLPLLQKTRVFTYTSATDGLRQILWGLFKKVVIADTCAMFSNPIFENTSDYPGSTLLVGAFLYTIQVYADFSGYSDMAIGFSRLLGFEITRNFHFPFFSRNIAEYWQKWHISLTTWMTEYVYTPLSFVFRKWGKGGIIAAILINFVLVGLWHGANWTFVVFGFVHGCYFIPLILRETFNKRIAENNPGKFPGIKELAAILSTFLLVMLTTVIFRVDTIADAFQYYRSLFSTSLLSFPTVFPSSLFLLIFFMFIVEWRDKNYSFGLAGLGKSWPPVFRLSLYLSLVVVIFAHAGSEQQFIYFQF